MISLSTENIFFASAAFDIPVLLTLVAIRPVHIHYGRSCGAPDHHAMHPTRIRRAALFADRRLLVFANSLFLFQLANASLLPLAGETQMRVEGRRSSLALSALIMLPQILVALLAPWAGRTANSWGRRPLLLLGLVIVLAGICDNDGPGAPRRCTGAGWHHGVPRWASCRRWWWPT